MLAATPDRGRRQRGPPLAGWLTVPVAVWSGGDHLWEAAFRPSIQLNSPAPAVGPRRSLLGGPPGSCRDQPRAVMFSPQVMVRVYLYVAVAPSRLAPRPYDDGLGGRADAFVEDAQPRSYAEHSNETVDRDHQHVVLAALDAAHADMAYDGERTLARPSSPAPGQSHRLLVDPSEVARGRGAGTLPASAMATLRFKSLLAGVSATSASCCCNRRVRPRHVRGLTARRNHHPPQSAFRQKWPTGENHRFGSLVDGLDDLGVVDSAEVSGRDREAGVAELPLDHDQRDPLARHLYGMRVPQLVRREPATDPGRDRRAVELFADARRCARPAACRSA
jgi:hypothetical protein